MRETYYRIESIKVARLKRILKIPAGVGLSLFIAARFSQSGGVLGISANGISILACVGLICFATIAFLHYGRASRLTLIQAQDGAVQMNIRNEEGEEISARGPWQWSGCFVREGFRYGMFKKNMFLYLYNNGKMFCVIRGHQDPYNEPPSYFIEARTVSAGGAPMFFTRDFNEIYTSIMKSDPLRIE